ncbi:TPA: hypothetical protein JG832_002422 [Enterobacter hormaechei subsp. xiangfangensis]|nr:hypothetical protein [Enterobacter hormaechei subsp. xiangfangensis]HAV1890558.1 hypothetical protein [Enterobacter hormaechei subsp. xiangfangensis]
MKKIIAVALGMSLLTGCVDRVADLTVASSKNYNQNSGKLVKGKRVTGTDSRSIIVVPTGNPNVKEALDKAIEQDKCAVALSDVVVNQKTVIIPVLILMFGKIQFDVTGNLILDQNQPGCENAH